MTNKLSFICSIIAVFGIFTATDAQNTTINGRITAFGNIGVNKASVTAQKAKASVVSDSMGNYSITCAEDDKLVIEANGFLKEKINLKNIDPNDSLNVDMKLGKSEKSRELATGYGHIDKDKITHAIERAETTNDYSEYNSVVDIIRGRVSGVQITGNSITIRGADTYHDQEPLIVVDGAVVDFTALNNISTSQVKSVDVLKGASASARYGSRGMQGVIVIQTKKSN